MEHEPGILAHISRSDWLAIISSLLVLVGALGTAAFAAWAKELRNSTEMLKKLATILERVDKRVLIMEIWAGQQDPEFHRLRARLHDTDVIP